ncbi:hypothetical protein CMI48_04555 [Candidatus Pacearchaeota archaeon]|nr:hypothetical protein [Candidatus Pacearchaeota archaeon]|tara:strand:+ start:865 stop:1272 length:408 start_codon:yes stop_codon:yes gene_type:complete
MITELVQANPKLTLLGFAALVTLAITIVNFFMLDKDKLRAIKERQKKLQAEMKEHQKAGNEDKLLELQKELFADTGEMFKHSMKPMLITFLPIIIFFGLIRNLYATTAIAGSWIWWYLLFSLITSMIFRKLFRMP